MDASRCRQAIQFHQFVRCGNQTDAFCLQYLRGVSRKPRINDCIIRQFFFTGRAIPFPPYLYLTLHAIHGISLHVFSSMYYYRLHYFIRDLICFSDSVYAFSLDVIPQVKSSRAGCESVDYYPIRVAGNVIRVICIRRAVRPFRRFRGGADRGGGSGAAPAFLITSIVNNRP